MPSNPNAHQIRGMLRLGLRAMVACGTAILFSGCLPLLLRYPIASIKEPNCHGIKPVVLIP